MYVIENKQTKKWLTVGNNTTTDITHPGLISFDINDLAELYMTVTERNEDWKITKLK
jgi:hypothetical protein